MLFLQHDFRCRMREAIFADLFVKHLKKRSNLLVDASQSLYLSNEALLQFALLRVLGQTDLDRSHAVQVPTTEAVHKGHESLLLWWFFDGGGVGGFALDQLKSSAWMMGYSCNEISSKRSRMSSGSQVNAKANSFLISMAGSGSKLTDVFSSCIVCG